jgi:hypothetical protein
LDVTGQARPILARAFSVVNIHLMRAPAAFRCCSHAAISPMGVCTENLIRVADVMESLKLSE